MFVYKKEIYLLFPSFLLYFIFIRFNKILLKRGVYYALRNSIDIYDMKIRICHKLISINLSILNISILEYQFYNLFNQMCTDFLFVYLAIY